MIKRKNFLQFERVRTPKMNDGCSIRIYTQQKFERNNCMIEKTVWEDEKDFTLNVSVNLQNDRLYGKGKKSDVPDENLLASTNKISRKTFVPTPMS